MKVLRDDVTLHVEAAPPGGEPMLLLMGLGAQLVLWPEALCARLAARGARVIRMDNRDVGASSHLRHLPVPSPRGTLLRAALGLAVAAPYRLEEMADDACAVLDALAIPRAHIVGASMGGMIAQTMAITHPDRVASLTSIMSTPGDRRYALGARPRAVKALLAPRAKSAAALADQLVATFRAIGSRTHPPDEQHLRQAAATIWERGVNPAGFARQLAAVCAAPSRRRALGGIRVPTLVVHGAQDPLIPVAAGRATAAAIPGARLLVVEDMGHDLPAVRLDDIADAIAEVMRAAAP